MKKILSLLAAIALMFACQKNKPGGATEVVSTDIKLSTNELTIEKGASEVLSVTYTLSDGAKKDIIWESSNTSVATVADGVVVGVAPGSAAIIAKCGDATDKCKVTVVISATGIKLNKTSLELIKGKSETLVVIVEPEGSTDSVTWVSYDEAVATVADGLVTAVGEGEATIMARAGNQKAECKVRVSTDAVLEAIDLGLSVKWASFNLGATKPEEYGDYYAWGETEPKDDYSWSTYKWCNGGSNKLTKYNTIIYYGPIDNKTALEQGDDVAHVVLEDDWRMPTDAEWTELRENCTWTWTSDYNETGVAGRIVTSNKTGYVNVKK